MNQHRRRLIQFLFSDFDEDEELSENDLKKVITRLTNKVGIISEDSKEHVIKIVFAYLYVSCRKVKNYGFLFFSSWTKWM